MATLLRKAYDVVVVGAGIMGLNTAYQLARRDHNLNILVLEQGSSMGQGSTGYSTALLRCFYTFDTMVHAASEGLQVHKNWSNYIESDDPAGHLTKARILWLMGESETAVEAKCARLRRFGHAPSILSRNAVQEQFRMRVDDLAPDAAFLCEEGTGYFDPTGALTDLKAACERLGVQVLPNAAVDRIALNDEGNKAHGVCIRRANSKAKPSAPASQSRTPDTSPPSSPSSWLGRDKHSSQEFVSAGAVVNAAGPWSMRLNLASGIDLPWRIEPTRIQVAYKKCAELSREELAAIPATADAAGGIYFRPQLGSQQLLVGTILPEEESEAVDPDACPEYVEAERETRYISGLLDRLPFLEPRGAVTGFSAMYSVNLDDGHPVVGPHPQIASLYHAQGFTGHGFKIAPVVGSLLARAITNLNAQTFDTEVDAAFFAVDRTPHRVNHISVLA